MNKRQLLSSAIRSMLVIVLFAFMFVLFRSLSGPSLSSPVTAAFDDVVTGQTTLRRYDSRRVWVTRLSAKQRAQAKELDQLVVDATTGCTPTAPVCALSAAAQRSGIDIVFSLEPPLQLASGKLWFGGFVDPSNGSVYDRLGRAYKSLRQVNRPAALEVVSF